MKVAGFDLKTQAGRETLAEEELAGEEPSSCWVCVPSAFSG